MDDKKFEEWMERSLRAYEKIVPNWILQQKEIIKKRDELYPNYTLAILMKEDKKYISY
jgi:hypothetical protein